MVGDWETEYSAQPRTGNGIPLSRAPVLTGRQKRAPWQVRRRYLAGCGVRSRCWKRSETPERYLAPLDMQVRDPMSGPTGARSGTTRTPAREQEPLHGWPPSIHVSCLSWLPVSRLFSPTVSTCQETLPSSPEPAAQRACWHPSAQ